MKKIAVYNPFIETLGGGEKHIFSIADSLCGENGEVSVFWNRDLKTALKKRFDLKKTDRYIFRKNVFKQGNPLLVINALKEFDYFFYVTDGSYFFSLARKNYVYAMVPNRKLYRMTFLNRLKLRNFRFISISNYTSRWLKEWGIESQIITPYVFDNGKKLETFKKNRTILSVARFFPHLHSKNHPQIIDAFKTIKKNHLFENYRLILAGGLKEEDRWYFNRIKKKAGRDSSIVFMPNVSKTKLDHLYKQADYFWHFAGLGIDEKTHPDRVEHFGITPLEAMINGAVVFCHNSGGPAEFIKNNQNGYLFNDVGTLIENMVFLQKNPKITRKIRLEAQKTVKTEYNMKIFDENVKKLL